MNGRKLPDRREFLALGVGMLGVAAVPSLLRRPTGPVRRSVPVMGTVADVVVVHPDERWARTAVERSLAELRRVEALLSRFREGSDVGRVNGMALDRPVPVSEETAIVLHEALSWAEASGGAFDPSVGRAVALWDVAGRTAPPPPDRVRSVTGSRLHRSVEVERGGSGARVRFHDPRVSLDLGGIGKGWGVDAAARVLRDHGILHALVNVGGDLVAIGSAPDGDPWTVGVRDPERPGGLVTTLSVIDRAVATSGDYERVFHHEGRRYHHLVDPRTGAPARTSRRTVTVVAGRCADADAAATTAFLVPPDRARRMLARQAPGARIAHAG